DAGSPGALTGGASTTAGSADAFKAVTLLINTMGIAAQIIKSDAREAALWEGRGIRGTVAPIMRGAIFLHGFVRVRACRPYPR
ncbi:MAG TPA: hypothetical protein VIO38_00400, partial [Rariglobus sp.]